MANSILILVSTLLIISLALSEPSRRDDNGDKHTKHKEKDKSEENTTKNEGHDTKNKSNHDNEIPDVEDKGWEYENRTKVDARRVLYSKTVGKGKRPYMVYLQLTKDSAKAHKYRGWLCGGVIVDRYYVLTSAACVEDADHFYVVGGTTKFVDSFDYKDNECVCNNRRKVVWKCIPKNYKFDFQDSIKWSSNDIAIVKVDKPFKFGVTEKGCEFATDLICYNNVSRDLEKPGTKGFIAGWGSGSNFREGVYRRQKPYNTENAKCLQEAKVCIMDNEACAKKWSQRFREIITQFMICTKDVMKRLSEICDKRYANCTDVESRKSLKLADSHELSASSFNVDVGRHLRDPDDYTARRSSMKGGFCENDHGGPLIVKYQNKERVIGVISACKIDPKSHSCHGPFLYTSVFKNRQFISCSIFKDVEESCRRVFRSGITHEEWSVNWDNIKEDEIIQKEDKTEAKAVDNDNNADSDSDDKADSPESKEALRENKSEDKKSKDVSKEKTSTAAKKAKRTDGSSDSSASTSVEKSEEVKKKEKSKKKKSRSKSEKSDKKHSRSHKSSKKSKKSKGSVEPNLRSQDKKEVFYESSREENVNEPDDDE